MIEFHSNEQKYYRLIKQYKVCMKDRLHGLQLTQVMLALDLYKLKQWAEEDGTYNYIYKMGRYKSFYLLFSERNDIRIHGF